MDEARKEIWNAICEADDYLRSGMGKQLETAVHFGGNDMQPLMRLAEIYNRNKLVLSPDEQAACQSLLSTMENEANEFLKLLRTMLNQRNLGTERPEETKMMTNHVNNSLLPNFRLKSQQVGLLFSKHRDEIQDHINITNFGTLGAVGNYNQVKQEIHELNFPKEALQLDLQQFIELSEGNDALFPKEDLQQLKNALDEVNKEQPEGAISALSNLSKWTSDFVLRVSGGVTSAWIKQQLGL